MLARAAYTLLFYLSVPFVLLRLLWRSRRAPAYLHRWRERFGFVPRIAAGRKVIWVHSVSVGETLAAVPLIRQMMSAYPDALVAVTTMTPTGSERVRAAFGDRVYHTYAPYDLPDAVARFLRRVSPDVLVIMETELWPNIVHGANRRHIPIILANARLSAKSAEGYRRFPALTRPMLECLTKVAAQTREDGERFIELGLPSRALAVTGNIKFDLELDAGMKRAARELRRQWQGDSRRFILLAASTHRGEDEIILEGFTRVRQTFPDLLLVLVPRHPERFAEVKALCGRTVGDPVLRSSGRQPGAGDAVVLGDTMGELALFFGACDLTFVGGSLVPVGGHNMIEPAAWGVPVLTGPHLFNFAEASKLLLDAGGMLVVENARELAEQVSRLVADEGGRRAMGEAASAVAAANRGAMGRLLALISPLLS